jgi:hypothetical protein
MRLRRLTPIATRFTVLVICSLALGACATRTVTEKVFDDDRVTATLRGQTKSGVPVDRGYAHPAVIAPTRIANILSRIDLRGEGDERNERRPAIGTDSLYTIGDGLSKALSEADPSQEIVVLAIRKHKNFGIFDRDFLTSFIAYTKGEQLYIHMSRSDWEVGRKKNDRIPEPKLGDHPMKFRVVPSRGMALIDSQSVAADWRGTIFDTASRTSVTPDGKVVRRTILLEAESEPAQVAPIDEPLPAGLSATALRRLSDLEEQRERGQVSDSEYRVRRSEILDAH